MKRIFPLIFFKISLIYAAPLDDRIIGGFLARAGEFPYAAAIHISAGDGTYFCAGSLVNNQWILTSAFCVIHQIKSFVIQFGSNSLTSGDNRVIVSSTSSISHPDYNPNNLQNDVGLIKLRRPIEFNDYIQPIKLTEWPIDAGVLAQTVGWGQTSDSNSSLADQLRYVTLVTISNEDCSKVYDYQIIDEMVCAGGNYDEGICYGDSGGPLIMRQNNSEFVVGIATFFSGNGCENGDPSGFTRVYPFLDWIKNAISL